MSDHDFLIDLKLKYGKIFTVDVKGVNLYFRELTFEEHSKIIESQNIEGFSSADIEDFVLQAAIVYPEDFDIYAIPAGTVSFLAEEIIDLSGFYSVKLAKSVLEQKRSEASDVKNLMKAFVLATINSYSPEDLERMTFSQLAEKVALSEKIIEIQQGINGVEATDIALHLIDPEEEIQKMKDMEEKHNKAKAPGAANLNDPIANKLWGGG